MEYPPAPICLELVYRKSASQLAANREAIEGD